MTPPTYGAVNVSYVAPLPSPFGIQWSAEGQVLIVTVKNIYILVGTPNTSISSKKFLY